MLHLLFQGEFMQVPSAGHLGLERFHEGFRRHGFYEGIVHHPGGMKNPRQGGELVEKFPQARTVCRTGDVGGEEMHGSPGGGEFREIAPPAFLRRGAARQDQMSGSSRS